VLLEDLPPARPRSIAQTRARRSRIVLRWDVPRSAAALPTRILCCACFVLAALWSRAAVAETVALVTASSSSDEAARYLATQIDLPVVPRETVNARRLDALVAEARASWHEDLVVVIDTDNAVVSVVRPADGTIGSRALSPTAVSAPYAVALAAVELLEIVRSAPPARSAALPAPETAAIGTRWSFDAGVVQSVTTSGNIGLLQPSIGADLELGRPRRSVWFSVGLHATGLAPIRRQQVLLLADGPDDRGIIQYGKNELGLRLGAGHRQGAAGAVGWIDTGLAFIDTQAIDRAGTTIASDQRTAFWLGAGGELRYALAAGFSLGLGAGLAWFPVTSRFYTSLPGAPTTVLAFDEGNFEFRGRASVIWESPE
jgi:hypothetical protein